MNTIKLKDLLFEGMLLEADEIASLSQHADDYAKIISSLIKAPEGETKDAIDSIIKNANNPEKADISAIEPELEKAGVDDLDEAVGLAIAVISLIPKAIDLAGDGIDFLNRKIPGIKDEKWQEEAQEAKDALAPLKANFKKDKSQWKSTTKEDNSQKMLLSIGKKLADGDIDDATAKRMIAKSSKISDKSKEITKTFFASRKEYMDAVHHYDDEFGAKFWGKSLKEWGHKLHALYTSPIRGLLWLFGRMGLWKKMRDKKAREKTADIIYALSLVALAGYGAWTHLSHVHGLKDLAAIAVEVSDGGVSSVVGIEGALELTGMV
tara:strand:- start:501 stop:1466 length:966 start_codon:yes stop_codon:yes gene_type:complete